MAAPLGAQTELFAESRPGRLFQPRSATISPNPKSVFAGIKLSYLEALQAMGYSESEARFLHVVTNHSGYFVTRLFLSFTCGHWAKRTTMFWGKLQAKRPRAPNTFQ